MSGFFRYQRRQGAVLVGPDLTRFRLWAPSCSAVTLEREGLASVQMDAQDDGWFQCETHSGAGVRYRYRVADDVTVPDPASCSQPDDVHGASAVADPSSYQWTCPDWSGRPWEEAVIYEIHIGLGGGYRKIAEDLPRLAALGVTAIELMPLSEFPGDRNWGYDGVFPFAPESSYGTPDDLKYLIDQAHRFGLMIFLDVVYNHFGPDGNYIALYAPEFFSENEHTLWGSAIDFTRSQVREFFLDNALYWIMEFRFDGLRFDAVQAITERNWLEELHKVISDTIEAGRFVHLILENENNDAGLLRDGFTAQWNDDAHNALHVLLTGENEGYYKNFSKDPILSLAVVLEEGFCFQGQPSPMTGKPRGSGSSDLPAEKFILFLQNHDQVGNRALGERLTVLADPDALKAAYALMLLSPQIPMLFFGEEWGCRTPFFFFTSHNRELAEIVREGRRSEFASFSHFHESEKRKLIPDPNAVQTFEKSRPDRSVTGERDHKAWLELTRELLGLRQQFIVPRLKDAHSAGVTILADDEGASCPALLASWTMADGALLSIVINLGTKPVSLTSVPDGKLICARGEVSEVRRFGPGSIAVWLKDEIRV
ncbi:malto-oligosyltrehalose trehalohydrolase [Acetobacter fallax]|uniref:Malto-oligosyltrehalose trehalohydrolase n=1 Tax=Acetobacter fallax TaxID=1737473 RepID=A0ABX0KC74_9PROT|nr:malto-oligosyltrehalose trehalohydrolase [Acetobacter fallax]NHO34015.1 malto-oligosyltrehalose trehalohydrolase [Acetobacter fallax]NHO37549.1 malto-oligosyltrehalose trehalohydrolase [Acetobacter fallax]